MDSLRFSDNHPAACIPKVCGWSLLPGRLLPSSASLPSLWESTGNEALSVDVDAIQSKTGMEYDGVQADAIRLAATAKVMVLTGGPGTGKTTV